LFALDDPERLFVRCWMSSKNLWSCHLNLEMWFGSPMRGWSLSFGRMSLEPLSFYPAK
jgi:hypothetical protein